MVVLLLYNNFNNSNYNNNISFFLFEIFFFLSFFSISFISIMANLFFDLFYFSSSNLHKKTSFLFIRRKICYLGNSDNTLNSIK